MPSISNEQYIENAVRNRYQGYRMIKTPASKEKLECVKQMNSKIVTMDQVHTFAQETAKQIGFSGHFELKFESL